MRKTVGSLLLSLAIIFAAAPVARPYTYQFTSTGLLKKWPATTITVQVSPSFNAPANVQGGNARAAVTRALRRWSDAANINFNVVDATAELGVAANDGVNFITISSATSGFVPADRPGRARVSFDPATGNIVEADIAINPGLAFSTNTAHNTYDLESTLVHEIGHFLGLDHSGLVGASMQPRQGVNFTNGSFTLTETSVRTLSEDDLAGIRSLYGARTARQAGSITGTINYGAGAHVWAENADSGRVVAGTISRSDGTYRIDQLVPGNYRVIAEYLDGPVLVTEITNPQGPYAGLGSNPAFRAAEATTAVTNGGVANVPLSVTVAAPSINPRVQGLNGILTGAPVTIAAGATYRYYVGGDGFDAVGASDVNFDTPFITIDRASFLPSTASENAFFGSQFGSPVVSFNIRVADTAKWGDYSLRVRRPDTGETEFMAAGLTLDPYTDFVELNPIDNTNFFVRQQYRDFFFREPEEPGFSSWVSTLNNCPNQFNTDPNSPSAACDRISVSRSFFSSAEFRLKGFFVYRFYRAGLNRQPLYAEIIPDMIAITGSTPTETYQKRADFTNAFVQRAEFAPLLALSADAYVNTLMDRYGLQSITTTDPASPDTGGKVTLTRADLTGRLNTGALTRAQVLRAIADSDQVFAAEFNRGFVSMQYFGYLKRDAEPQGFQNWLNTINANPNDFRVMVNGFLNSNEYRLRFGPI